MGATLSAVPKKPSLVEQIEQDALDSSASLADALRKCIALGGRAGSAELRDWATRELHGYEGLPEVPDYRTVAAPIVIDGFSGDRHITGEQISVYDLPDFAQADISEEVTLRSGVGELEELIRSARAKGEPVRIGLPLGAGLARMMTAEFQDRFRAVERIYWSVSPTAVFGVVDQVRTRLVGLVAEVRAAASNPNSPSAEAVTNAVEVAIYGKARDIHISAAQSSGPGPATVTTPPAGDRPWWRRTKVLWGIAVGLATIAGTVILWLQWK